ncbi:MULTISPECIES: V-type ATP synthase subunit E [unclassified Parvimonas]|jgi:V-type proton ATPase subunit E 1|uniref:V-type ATP synthase subunit E n=1 Tax=unclassified Parvimonas TaxID=1151464 RepID=UPI002B4A065F|nr:MULTISPECIES: V-type ATP synthase subunit E [unclassified Parvimonas]MEB3025288.1 V-type ATP synthase subunit E [Parvimonas sp. M13]MEB3072711.1 V-type ATP synthase subunit E [Parvimonas sp. C2]MEB3089468.1 V-type ATP synthase subunit E [Parvimonas sp. M20]
MITIEDKIESFKRILNEEIDEKYDEELKKIASETERLMTEYKAKKYEEIEKLKREYRTKLDNKSDKIRSKTLKEGQDIILNTNKEIYDEFFKALKEELNNSYMTEKGVSYLKNTLKNVKSEINSNDIIYVYEKSFERDNEIIKNVLGDIKVEKSLDIKVGGFEIENVERTYRLNYSLDFLLTTKYQKILAKLKKEIGINN